MEGMWSALGLILGGGAVGSILTGFFNYLLARAKQPVDQYDKLVVWMKAVMDQERAHFEARLEQDRQHCNARMDKMEKEIQKLNAREDVYITREGEYREKIGKLEGRLMEQQRMLDVLLLESKTRDLGDASARAEKSQKQS